MFFIFDIQEKWTWNISNRGLFQKNPNGRWGYTFLKRSPGNFRFVTLSKEIPGRMRFYHWKFCKFVWHPLEIPKSKTKTHGNSTLVFLEHPWKFHLFLLTPRISTFLFFNTPRNSMSSTPPVWIFSGIPQLDYYILCVYKLIFWYKYILSCT